MPPPAYARATLEAEAEERLRRAITARILAEVDLDGQVAAAVAKLKFPAPKTLTTGLRKWLGKNREQSWRDRIADLAAALVDGR